MKKFSRKSSSVTALPTAILTADWHIRATVPVCRTDDFLAAMWRKVDFILDLAKKYRIPILLAGDIGLKSQWPNWLEEEFIRMVKSKSAIDGLGCPFKIWVIPGQHDLPDHNLNLWRKSSIGVLHVAEVIEVIGPEDDKRTFGNLCIDDLNIFPFPYGIEICYFKKNNANKMMIVAMAHTLVTERAPESFLADKAQSAMSLLQKFSGYNLILTGDNHKPFVVEYEGRLLVNPGSLMRTTADQVDHKPRVYLWYAEGNKVEPVYLPIEEGVINRDHIDLQEAKDERIESYILRLKEEVEIGLDFYSNLESYFRMNRVRKPVQDKVWKAVGDK